MRFKSSTYNEFFRFCAVGVVGFLVDAGTLYAFASLTGWMVGRVLSFLAAASATWWLNRRYTFASSSTQHTSGLREYLRYLTSMMAGGGVNYLCYAATIHWLTIPESPLVGVAIGSAVGLAVNFSLARWIVYRNA